ncbi:MAG TPA: hypothetical protein PLW34_02885 [Termitinemataceae bacterium]|nr:hypothetical protein [Termitinemataceae bacterium]HOM22859.1 hypothetical protein [Termitinemataceae bacterium]HPP99800.1 hypothetical protein [Termitinemataceae bacterium]
MKPPINKGPLSADQGASPAHTEEKQLPSSVYAGEDRSVKAGPALEKREKDAGDHPSRENRVGDFPGQRYRGTFRIVSINVSPATGVRKTPVERAEFLPGFGLAGDAHGGLKEDRQVSLLAWEDIQQANQALLTYEQRGLSCTKATEHRSEGTAQDSARSSSPENFSLMPGDFAENLTTEGVALTELPLGSHLVIGPVVLEVSKIGKECHAACEIRRIVGDCIMPRRGIFARVINGGVIHRDDMGAYYF